MTTLADLLHRAADVAVAEQRVDGSFAPGHNGSYHDPETPVRNTAHWTILLDHVAATSGDPRHRAAVRRAVGYLLSSAARPAGGTFVCRTNPRKDACNGLIGQAWAIEALATVGLADRDAACVHAATDVFLAHPFDTARGLWRRVEPDGRVLGLDPTFNHQLWFAAVAAPLARTDARIRDRIVAFLDAVVAGHLQTTRSGRVRHLVIRNPRTIARHPLRESRTRWQLPAKEIGYQSFNLYAFALLRRQFPDHPLWWSRRLRRAVAYVRSPAYEEAIGDNPFGFPYNPPGFEVAYALAVLDAAATTDDIRRWVQRQIRFSWDPTTGRMDRGAPDPWTSAARFYEATRLPDVAVDVRSSPTETRSRPGVRSLGPGG